MILAVEDLRFSRQGRTVLDEVAFRLAPGTLLAVAGPNGVGKTTLLRLLLGLLAPDSGRIAFDGRDVRAFARRDLARLLAYVPQGAPVPQAVSVFEAVLLGRRPHLAWRPGPADLEGCARMLCRLGLDDLAGRELATLSGGQLQKVSIARALLQETACLLLDEPTASLDLRHQLEVMELLRALARDEGKTVLASLHDINLARRFADVVLLLAPGRVHGFGPPGEVVTEEALRLVYGVEVKRLEGDGMIGFFPVGPSQ